MLLRTPSASGIGTLVKLSGLGQAIQPGALPNPPLPTSPTACDNVPYGQAIPGTAMVKVTMIGTCVDCSSWWNWILYPACRERSTTEWEQMAQFQPPPSPPPVGAPPSDLPPVSGEDAQAVIDALIAEQIRQQQEDYFNFYGQQPNVPPKCTGDGVPTLLEDGSWKCPESKMLMYVVLAGLAVGVGAYAFAGHR